MLLYSLIVVWRYPEHNPKHWIPPLHGTGADIRFKITSHFEVTCFVKQVLVEEGGKSILEEAIAR